MPLNISLPCHVPRLALPCGWLSSGPWARDLCGGLRRMLQEGESEQDASSLRLGYPGLSCTRASQASGRARMWPRGPAGLHQSSRPYSIPPGFVTSLESLQPCLQGPLGAQ